MIRAWAANKFAVPGSWQCHSNHRILGETCAGESSTRCTTSCMKGAHGMGFCIAHQLEVRRAPVRAEMLDRGFGRCRSLSSLCIGMEDLV